MKNMKKTLLVCFVLLASISVASAVDTYLENAKDLLVGRIDKAISQIEDMKSAVDSRQEFSAEEKQEIKSNFDSYMGYFEDKKGEIEGAETRIDLRLILVDLRYEWSQLQKYKNNLRGLIFVSRFGDISERAGNLSERIDAKISELNASEEEKTEIKELKSEFDADILLMQGTVDEAEAKFREGDNVGGYALLKEAKDYLQNAYNTLKGIVRKFRELQG